MLLILDGNSVHVATRKTGISEVQSNYKYHNLKKINNLGGVAPNPTCIKKPGYVRKKTGSGSGNQVLNPDPELAIKKKKPGSESGNQE